MMFIQGLWGDERFRRYAKVRGDVERAAKRPLRPAPVTVLCYGLDNLAFLRRLGFQAICIHPEPVQNYSGHDVDRDHRQDYTGSIAYGISSWRHKLEVILSAVEEFKEVVWLDWDCTLELPLPGDFWRELRRQQPLQMGLRWYRRPQCGWRESDQRLLPHGAWIYCRDPQIIRDVIAIHCTLAEGLCMDEHAFAMWFDQQLGGWKGIEAYRSAGYAPRYYAPPTLPYFPEEAVFCERLPGVAREKVFKR